VIRALLVVATSGLLAIAAVSTALALGSQEAPGSRLGIGGFIVEGSPGEIWSGQKEPKWNVYSLEFDFGAVFLSEHDRLQPSSETVRFTLPAGLTWKTGSARAIGPPGDIKNFPPNGWGFEPSSESCNIVGQVATCQASGVPSGTAHFSWTLRVAARAPGTYLPRVEIANPAANRPPREGYLEARQLRLTVHDEIPVGPLPAALDRRYDVKIVGTATSTMTSSGPARVREQVTWTATIPGIRFRVFAAVFADLHRRRTQPGIFLGKQTGDSSIVDDATSVGRMTVLRVTRASGRDPQNNRPISCTWTSRMRSAVTLRFVGTPLNGEHPDHFGDDSDKITAWYRLFLHFDAPYSRAPRGPACAKTIDWLSGFRDWRVTDLKAPRVAWFDTGGAATIMLFHREKQLPNRTYGYPLSHLASNKPLTLRLHQSQREVSSGISRIGQGTLTVAFTPRSP
jgi:hypothetical protein